MKTEYLTPYIVLLLTWIALSDCKCVDNPNSNTPFLKGDPGKFLPVCDADGNYEVQQCDQTIWRCFCVDRITGVEIEGTSKPAGEDTVDCATVQSTTVTPTVSAQTASPVATGGCIDARRSAISTKSAFVPECTDDGHYKAKQCNDIEVICYCVDKIKGTEIPETRRRQGDSSVDCEKAQPTKAPITASPSSTQATEELQLNFDENDVCYNQNKKTFDYWNQKMKMYEEQVAKWQKSMTDYEEYIKSQNTNQQS